MFVLHLSLMPVEDIIISIMGITDIIDTTRATDTDITTTRTGLVILAGTGLMLEQHTSRIITMLK